jgi:hypothetical protein
MDETKDKFIWCVDCGGEFTFTVGEQQFYISKSLSEPKRCQQCRNQRRANLVPDKGRMEENGKDS